ncbi:MAG TPA: alpha/beta hydrolase [Pilimelia sp.]|nr:alpha/beta hydrolase [Pilimelia sp.]
MSVRPGPPRHHQPRAAPTRARSLFVAAVVATSLAVPAAAHAGPPRAAHKAAAAPAGAAAAGVAWGRCPPAPPGQYRHPLLQCATVRVPLDHRRPRGRSIGIAISRIPATSPAARRGVLLTNPGGPGERGLDFPGRLATWLPPDIMDRYDVVGMDPRGIGDSAAISCGVDPATPLDLRLPYPAADGSIARNVAYARATAARCAELSGDLLPHISTTNTARDLDLIRAALGEPRISYFGTSYGSYLGTVYRALFPRRVDRMVLDSALDPRLVWRGTWLGWGRATADRLPDFTAWAAARDATLHLGATAEAVSRRFRALAARLDASPVRLPDGTTATGNILRELTRELLYDDSLFPLLADLWRYLDTGAGTPIPVPAADDNFMAAFYALSCNDAAWPRSPVRYARDVAADRRRWPDTAGMPANIWPCAFWPYRRVEPPVAVTGGGSRNVLIVHQTRDPAVPLSSAQGLREVLGSAAALVTVDGGGHLAFGRGSCADPITVTFLATGVLPAADRSCPAPPATGERRVSGSRSRVPRG